MNKTALPTRVGEWKCVNPEMIFKTTNTAEVHFSYMCEKCNWQESYEFENIDELLEYDSFSEFCREEGVRCDCENLEFDGTIEGGVTYYHPEKIWCSKPHSAPHKQIF